MISNMTSGDAFRELGRKLDGHGELLKEHDERTQKVYLRLGELGGEIASNRVSIDHLNETVGLKLERHDSDIKSLKKRVDGVVETGQHTAVTVAHAEGVTEGLTAGQPLRDLPANAKRRLAMGSAGLVSLLVTMIELARHWGLTP